MVDIADFLRGKWPNSREITEEIADLAICRATGWSLEYVNGLKELDVEQFAIIKQYYVFREQLQLRKSGE